MSTATGPQESDFPAELQPVIYSPPNSKPSNVILFLPGLGDTSANFSGFAKALNLPDAVTVTLQPPFHLRFPAGPGQHWSDDLQFDQATGSLVPDSPPTKSEKLVARVIEYVLVQNCCFAPVQIHLFGFRKGGSVALSVLLESRLRDRSLGSVISIGGPIPTSANDSATKKSKTPVLLLGVIKGAFLRADQSSVKRVKANFEFVEYHRWKKGDDTLPQSREGVLPMMQFLAGGLRSRRGVPEGAVEMR